MPFLPVKGPKPRLMLSNTRKQDTKKPQTRTKTRCRNPMNGSIKDTSILPFLIWKYAKGCLALEYIANLPCKAHAIKLAYLS